MRARRAIAAVSLLLTRPLAADEGRAAEVAAWITGTFELKSPGSDGAPAAVRIVIVAVPRSRIANGALVLYREDAAVPKLDEPIRQRFYRLEEDGNAVRLRAFDPKDPILVRGKWRDPSSLALYGASDMRERPGCAILLRKSGELWKGETAGPDCPSTVRTAVTMTSALVLAQDGFTEWDRGFDDKGRQTSNPPEGGMRFVRTSMSAPVDEGLVERSVGRRPERVTRVERTAAASPAASEAKAKEGFSANGKEGRGTGVPSEESVLELIGPHSPSKKITITEIRGGRSTHVPLRRVFDFLGTPIEGADARRALASAVLLVTGRDGSSAAFSADEVLATDGPELDLTGVPSLVFPRNPGRAVPDVVSIELKVLATSSRQP